MWITDSPKRSWSFSIEKLEHTKNFCMESLCKNFPILPSTEDLLESGSTMRGFLMCGCVLGVGTWSNTAKNHPGLTDLPPHLDLFTDPVVHDGLEVVTLNFIRSSVSPWYLQLNVVHLNIPSAWLSFVEGLGDLSGEWIRVHTFPYRRDKSLRSCRWACTPWGPRGSPTWVSSDHSRNRAASSCPRGPAPRTTRTSPWPVKNWDDRSCRCACSPRCECCRATGSGSPWTQSWRRSAPAVPWTCSTLSNSRGSTCTAGWHTATRRTSWRFAWSWRRAPLGRRRSACAKTSTQADPRRRSEILGAQPFY